ncbi:MAG: hypothetical protein JWN25_2939 [Verrucomicrobiales bacterium]|nr:hypothetical protein [Verrucomicrobiales bacterium]
MKHNNNHFNSPGPEAQLQKVRFEFTHPTAKSVCLSGTFNGWSCDKPMRTSGSGDWWKETTLAPGNYEYCLVVDGEYIPDPRIQTTVPNPFGGRNSVMRVCHTESASHLHDAKNLPMKNTNL